MAAGEPFHLVSLLQARCDRRAGKTKRVRTRNAIVAATAQQMEEHGYANLTIEGIVEAAGMARGTFYLYFSNRSEAVFAVRRKFSALMRARRPRRTRGRGPYEVLCAMNLFYVRTYRLNARLLAGREALTHDQPKAALLRDFLNHRWAKMILRDIIRRKALEPGLEHDRRSLLAVRATIAMSDELLRETLIHDSPLMRDLGRDDETLAEVMSILWYRMIYGEHPQEALPLLGVGEPSGQSR